MSIIAFRTDTSISGVRVVGGGADRDEMKKSPIAYSSASEDVRGGLGLTLFSSLETFWRDASRARVSMTLVLAASDFKDGRMSINNLTWDSATV